MVGEGRGFWWYNRQTPFMEKKFDRWNLEKKNFHNRRSVPYCHPRELWWCALGVNIGFEQDGTGELFDHPVIILKVLSAQTCLVVPLTKSIHQQPLRTPVGLVEGKEARAVISQMRVVDTKRLIRKIGFLEIEQFEHIRKTVKDML